MFVNLMFIVYALDADDYILGIFRDLDTARLMALKHDGRDDGDWDEFEEDELNLEEVDEIAVDFNSCDRRRSCAEIISTQWQPEMWFVLVKEASGGQSYGDQYSIRGFNDREDALGFVADYFDTEHNRSDALERRCEDCKCPAECGDDCSCRMQMLKELEIAGKASISISCGEGAYIKLWRVLTQ